MRRHERDIGRIAKRWNWERAHTVPDTPAEGRFYTSEENPLAEGWAVSIAAPTRPQRPWLFLSADCLEGTGHKDPQSTTDRLISMVAGHNPCQKRTG